MEDNNQNKKDYKKLFKWDEEPDEETQEELTKKKMSKKVLKRQAREIEKQRVKRIYDDNNKSRLSKKGKIWITVAAAIVIVALAVWAVFGYFSLIDYTKTVAKVDDSRITVKDINLYIEFLKNQDTGTIPPKDDPQYIVLQQNILDAIIVLRLLQQYANKNGLIVTTAEIDEEYSKIIVDFASEEAFEKELKDKKINKRFLREQLSDQVLRQKVFDKAIENVVVAEEEILNHYEENRETLFAVPEQVKVSHILIQFDVPSGTEPDENIKSEAKSRILDIDKKISQGEDFAELAKQYSEDSTSAVIGGDIGFVSRGQTVPEFEEAAFALKINEVSDIVETVYGYHIIKLIERNDSYIKDFEEVKDTIEPFLLNNKQMEEWRLFLISLIKNSNIIYTTELKGQLLEWAGITEDAT